MAIQTPAQWLASQNSGTTLNTKTSTNSKTKVQTPAEWLKTQPVEKPTLGSKVAKVGKELVKGIVSPVATMVARPVQLGATILGATPEQINKVNLGGYIAPVPQSGKDVLKDVGRGIETVALGLGGGALKGAKLLPTVAKESAIGATFGLGAGLEQGGTAKDVLKSTALGGVIGAAVPVALKGASKLLKGKTIQTAEKLATKEVTKLPPLDKSDYETILKPKLESIPKPKSDEITVIYGGEGKNGQYVDTDIKTALNRGVNENTQVKNIKKSELVLPSEDRAARGERIINKIEEPITQPINVTPEISKQADIITEQARMRSPNPETFESGTHKIWAEKILAQPRSHIENVLNGIEQPLEGVPVPKYYDVLSDLVSKEGNNNKILELAFSKPKEILISKTGQNLSALSQMDKENTVNLIADVIKTKENNLPNIILKGKDKEINTIKNKIQEVFKEINTPTREVISEALESLKCK